VSTATNFEALFIHKSIIYFSSKKSHRGSSIKKLAHSNAEFESNSLPFVPQDSGLEEGAVQSIASKPVEERSGADLIIDF
jgi:hypothetical protein